MRTRDPITWIVIPVAVFYLGWNCFFWFRGRLAPSLFQSITGWPCPSTGCMRSLDCWFAGDWREALRFNPFTLIFMALLIASAAWLARQLLRREPPHLPGWFGGLWLTVLALAWIATVGAAVAFG